MKIHEDSYEKLNCKTRQFIINIFGKLTGTEAAELRKKITDCSNVEYDTIFIDARDVTDTDLSGINEIIHTIYTLQFTHLKLVFVYRKRSVVEKWVKTTRLDKFIDTVTISATKS